MFYSKAKVWAIQVICVLVLACTSLSFAAETDSTKEAVSDSTVASVGDTSAAVVNESKKKETRLADYWIWPFEKIIQPFLNALIFPLAKPIDYIFSNGVVEKSVDLITFGADRNVMIYPSFNFKPGSSTMLGANYRHRNLFFNKDYAVVQMGYFANGDFNFTARYTKHSILGTSLFTGFRFDLMLDRDHVFTLPETKTYFTQPDSTFKVMGRLGHPLNKSGTLNLALQATVRYNNASLPDVNDSILVDDIYSIADHGLYQKGIQIPLEVSLLYDDLDNAFAPSRGSRISFTGIYGLVGDYTGLDPSFDIEKSKKNHDYIRTELLFQHYFFLGSSKEYVLSATEARKNRKFYTDFSWEEAIRIWKPENVLNTLFERRVIAVQARLIDVWELENAAPFNVLPTLNARTPLRGYADSWDVHHLFTVSCEYRWPVDRFVDGVVFDEYAMSAPEINKWSRKNIYNSWGFGIRVRQPNFYLFRVQLGFHGLHGVNMIVTCVPEFK